MASSQAPGAPDASEQDAHVASKSRSLLSRLFRLRGSPDARDPPVSDRAPVVALFRSLHLRGKSASCDDAASSQSSSDGGENLASSTASAANFTSVSTSDGRKAGKGRRNAMGIPASETKIPRGGGVDRRRTATLMESTLAKITPHRYWHSKVSMKIFLVVVGIFFFFDWVSSLAFGDPVW